MCPNCGAANPLYVVDLPRKVTDPKTIAELQEYCAERGMPLLRMRFFIGEDIKEPKAFGIYKDSHGDCKALRWASKILANTTTNNRIKELARNLKELITSGEI